MMHTRCPACQTVFRVTSEQLRAKAGKVRCGRCQTVFNAFDQLLDTPPVPPADVSSSTVRVSRELARGPADELAGIVPPDAGPEPTNEFPEAFGLPPAQAAVPEAPSQAPPVPETAEMTRVAASTAAADEGVDSSPPAVVAAAATAAPREETPEASVRAVRAAGLAAAREISETPGYNRWASGVLAGDASGSFSLDEERPLRWPFVLAALLLMVALAAQLLLHYRVEATARHPELRPFFAALGIEVGLPRHSDRVSIESSDLQSDNARGLLLLQAVLRNSANYAQEWPALELTLTDARDAPLARRVLQAADYLPPGDVPPSLQAASDIPVRLWIEPQGVTAAGYRLYVFYP
jgi:predicted Zn finger-like uncharacterized protein